MHSLSMLPLYALSLTLILSHGSFKANAYLTESGLRGRPEIENQNAIVDLSSGDSHPTRYLDLAFFEPLLKNESPGSSYTKFNFHKAINNFLEDTEDLYQCLNRIKRKAGEKEVTQTGSPLSVKENSGHSWWRDSLTLKERAPYMGCFNDIIIADKKDFQITPAFISMFKTLKGPEDFRRIAMSLVSTSFLQLLSKHSKFSQFVMLLSVSLFGLIRQLFPWIHNYLTRLHDRIIETLAGYIAKFLIRSLTEMTRIILMSTLPAPPSTAASFILVNRKNATDPVQSVQLTNGVAAPLFGNDTALILASQPSFEDEKIQVQYLEVIEEFQEEWNKEINDFMNLSSNGTSTTQG
ncbi:MAG: hypothetical protein DHS80DRAFT_22888 [Piptocephalis tieghemiana]|nr:MAG: hypothetical protein DHS80DRAFT_22888 [Piptocephalis tieghemiana]